MKKAAFLAAAAILVAGLAFPFASIAATNGSTASSIGTWTLSAGSGLGTGTANTAAGPFAVYKGNLYVGTSNNNGCQVRVKSGNSWNPVNPAGFGSANNKSISSLKVFGDNLYAGTANETDGCGIWSYNGTTWTNVASGGFGNKDNLMVTAMEVFNNKLYAGTTNYKITLINPGSDGAGIWSSGNGTTWTSVASGGFGDTLNEGVTALKSFNGNLYAGTARAQVAISWVTFPTVMKLTLTSVGCELRRLNGSNWDKVAGNGFSDVRNIAANTMEIYGGKLMIGTTNGDGSATLEVMSQKISDFTYQTNGLCVYRYNGSTLTRLVSGGFNNINDFSAGSMTAMKVGSSNLLLAAVGVTQGQPRVEVYNGSTWFSGSEDGFGNSNNTGMGAIATFSNSAYVGTGNSTQGCEVWYGTPPTSKVEPTTFYFAEGTCRPNFDPYFCIQNPGSTAANVTLTFMKGDGTTASDTVTVPKNSRTTVLPRNKLGTGDDAAHDFSTKVQCTNGQPIVVERPMYFNYNGAWTGGHDVVGFIP